MPRATLDDRAVIAVSGADAEHFLQNILTCDLDALAPGTAMPGALLSPQGKILFDFLIARDGDAGGFLLDCRADIAADFVRRLTLYRLRAKVEIVQRAHGLVTVAWGNDSGPSDAADAGTAMTRWRDARFKLDTVERIYGLIPPSLTQPGQATGLARPSDPLKGEGVASAERDWPAPKGADPSWSPSPLRGGARGGGAADTASAADWLAFRIASGVPESGTDYALGDAFPHDALLDQTGGVGFRKGCYVGQEVVSRMQHRGTARRRFLVAIGDAPLPAPGTDIRAGGKPIGTLGSVAGARGLALVRIDKVKAAQDEGLPIMADTVAVTLAIPAWAGFALPSGTAPGDD